MTTTPKAGFLLGRSATALWLSVLPLSCSKVELVTLGHNAARLADATAPRDSGPIAADAGGDERDAAPTLEPFEFEAPVLVEAIYSGTKDDNPTLTWDLTEIYFSSSRGGDSTDLWWASRANASDPFGTPSLLDFSSSSFDASPAIEGDGLTLWFSQDRDDGLGGLDVYQAQRATREGEWQPATLVSALSSDADDIPRPTGAGSRVMPLASRRDTGSDYLTYAATRPSDAESFAAPVLLEELVMEGRTTADAFLTDDGLTILYNQAGEDGGDLFAASRASVDEAFRDQRPLTDLNTAGDERDPWLSPDGSMLFFASDRDGALAIYQARRR